MNNTHINIRKSNRLISSMFSVTSQTTPCLTRATTLHKRGATRVGVNCFAKFNQDVQHILTQNITMQKVSSSEIMMIAQNRLKWHSLGHHAPNAEYHTHRCGEQNRPAATHLNANLPENLRGTERHWLFFPQRGDIFVAFTLAAQTQAT